MLQCNVNSTLETSSENDSYADVEFRKDFLKMAIKFARRKAQHMEMKELAKSDEERQMTRKYNQSAEVGDDFCRKILNKCIITLSYVHMQHVNTRVELLRVLDKMSSDGVSEPKQVKFMAEQIRRLGRGYGEADCNKPIHVKKEPERGKYQDLRDRLIKVFSKESTLVLLAQPVVPPTRDLLVSVSEMERSTFAKDVVEEFVFVERTS